MTAEQQDKRARVIELAARLTKLMAGPQPDLASWHGACERVYRELLDAARASRDAEADADTGAPANAGEVLSREHVRSAVLDVLLGYGFDRDDQSAAAAEAADAILALVRRHASAAGVTITVSQETAAALERAVALTNRLRAETRKAVPDMRDSNADEVLGLLLLSHVEELEAITPNAAQFIARRGRGRRS